MKPRIRKGYSLTDDAIHVLDIMSEITDMSRSAWLSRHLVRWFSERKEGRGVGGAGGASGASGAPAPAAAAGPASHQVAAHIPVAQSHLPPDLVGHGNLPPDLVEQGSRNLPPDLVEVIIVEGDVGKKCWMRSEDAGAGGVE